MDTTQLVRQHFLPEYPPLSRGHIAGVVELVAGKPKQKAAVTAFTDLLMVILPGASSEALYGPCKWGAIHGTRLPAVGAEVQVGVDETNHPVVLWWEGEQKEPTTAEAFKQASALGFEHAWENFEAGARKAEYRKNPLGTVELRGIVKAGESAKSAFTLPVAYRPKEEKSFIVNTHGVPGAVFVDAAGTVRPTDITAGASKEYTYLDSVSFSVE